MNVNYITLIIFIAISVINIYFVKTESKKGIYITKPLLMPMVIIFYVLSTKDINWLIVGALVFGCIGDIFLMLPRRQFILGLISFLIGHVFYIKAFLDPIQHNHILLSMLIFGIPYTLCNIFTSIRALPHKNLKGITKIFGILYIIAISFMGFSSTIRIFYIEGFKFFTTFIGSMLFIVSDYLIAINNLTYKSKNSGVFIMLTYILGQFLIVLGFI